ncbi:MAG: acyltransferase [Campylobacterales bacterium]|nr:acyltransferase [Campylobacterales bacterium]
MTIPITNVAQSTAIVIFILLTIFFLSLRKTEHSDLFPIRVTQELKGFGILSIVFAHIAYMLVSDSQFLYPLSIAAGTGVDLFLFISGFGLTVGMMKKTLSVIEFYKRRLIKVFIPFWIVLFLLFIADAGLLHINYSPFYMAQSTLGWFPNANADTDVNSPFWYITWILIFYILFPLFFNARRPWIAAIILAVIANFIAILNPFNLQANWLHSLHTFAFSLGMLLAWFLSYKKNFVEKLKLFRSESTLLRYTIIASMLFLAAYMVSHATPNDWPFLSMLVEKFHISSHTFINQSSNLLVMFALIIVFSLKKLDNKFFYVFGVYSYEIYLLHWPLMARYDTLFHSLPAWLALFMWLLSFIAIGWLLQKFIVPLGIWIDSK